MSLDSPFLSFLFLCLILEGVGFFSHSDIWEVSHSHFISEILIREYLFGSKIHQYCFPSPKQYKDCGRSTPLSGAMYVMRGIHWHLGLVSPQ